MLKNHRPWSYGCATLLLSAAMYGLVIISGQPYMSFPIGIFTLLGGFMPFLVALLFIKLEKREIRKFLKQCFSFRSIKKQHWLLLMGFVVFLTVTPVLTTNYSYRTSQWLSNTLSVFIPIGFIFGAMEEPGWRGYMQKRANDAMNPFLSSVIVGIFWMLWHFPLFFLENTYQSGLGLFTLDFWIFNFSLIVAAPFYAYLFYATKYSIPVVMIFHGLSNVLREVLAKPNPYHAFVVELILLIFVITVGRKYFFNKRHNK